MVATIVSVAPRLLGCVMVIVGRAKQARRPGTVTFVVFIEEIRVSILISNISDAFGTGWLQVDRLTKIETEAPA